MEQVINCKLQLYTIPSHIVHFSTIRFHKFSNLPTEIFLLINFDIDIADTEVFALIP